MLNDYGKSLFKPLCSVQTVVLAAAVIFILSLLTLSSSELASWAQALGSIAAIWGAFQISNRQVERQQSERAEERNRQASAFFAVAKNAVDAANNFVSFTQHSHSFMIVRMNWNLMYSHSIESSFDSLKLLPAHELGTYDLVIAHSGLVASVASILVQTRNSLGTTALPEQEYIFLLQELSMRLSNLNFYWVNFTDAFAAAYPEPIMSNASPAGTVR